MIKRSSITKLAIAAGLVLAAGAGALQAFNPQPEPPGFGMMGITSDQTARLNVVNVGGCRAGTGDSPAGPCRVHVELAFFDADGNVLARVVKPLDGAHAASLDLDGATLLTRADAIGHRAEVRASVRVVALVMGGERVVPLGAAQTTLVPTVEVFDNFGPDAGKSRMGWTSNHNETLVRDDGR